MSFLLLMIAIIITIWASVNVNSKFKKFSKVRSSSGMRAEEVADFILRSNGIYDVKIDRIAGNLTDHYDPTTKTLRLSDSVYGKSSISAIGVAAHECGHAIQHNVEYGPLVTRGKLVPIANISSHLAEIMIVLGIIFSATGLIDFGIILFSAVVLFHLVTLPVEFNASARACNIIENSGYFNEQDLYGTKKVLSAAAMTYVASALVAVVQLVRLIAMRKD